MKVYIAGHTGMVGGAIANLLGGDPNVELVTRTRSELDLTQQDKVESFLSGIWVQGNKTTFN